MARSGVQIQARTAGDRSLDQLTGTYLARLPCRLRMRNRSVQASTEATWEEVRGDAWA
jgi:hypothetical protein